MQIMGEKGLVKPGRKKAEPRLPGGRIQVFRFQSQLRAGCSGQGIRQFYRRLVPRPWPRVRSAEELAEIRLMLDEMEAKSK